MLNEFYETLGLTHFEWNCQREYHLTTLMKLTDTSNLIHHNEIVSEIWPWYA